MPRKALLSEGETGWQPYGTTGILCDVLPPYIARLLGVKPPENGGKITHVRPAFLEPVLRGIETLVGDAQHQERAHESLVEDFLAALGYQKHKDIRYRQGRVDITLTAQGRPVAIIEVKKAWGFEQV